MEYEPFFEMNLLVSKSLISDATYFVTYLAPFIFVFIVVCFLLCRSK